MRAGRIVSLVLVLIVTTVATGARAFMSFATDLDSASTFTRIAVFGAVVFAVTSAILIPLGFMLDRTLGQLRRDINEGLAGDSTTITVRSKWLRPLTRALVSAVDRIREREAGLRTQLSDLEIRHRVSEAYRRQIEAVLHALQEPVIVSDAFNEMIMANDAAGRMLGFNPQQAQHCPVEQFIQNATLRQIIRDARTNLDFNHPRHVEIEVAPTDENGGAPTVFDVRLQAVPNHKNELGAIVTIMHDLTREREVSKMKTDFVSKASHELRTPLSSIRAYIEMLVDGELDHDPKAAEAQRHEFYRVIQNETDRLGRLIDNMLNISRIEAGIVQVQREVVDIASVIQRAVQTIGPHAAEKQITVHTRLEGERDRLAPSPVRKMAIGSKAGDQVSMPVSTLTVEGDSDMLYQVVLNLLSNAVKYTPEGGRVTVSADTDGLGVKRNAEGKSRPSGNSVQAGSHSRSHAAVSNSPSVVISVTDTGLGIPPEALPRLFEKFYRIENYKRMAKGTGLGLNLCKQIVETVHGGQLGVDSTLGMGSKFWFSIPLKYAGKKAA